MRLGTIITLSVVITLFIIALTIIILLLNTRRLQKKGHEMVKGGKLKTDEKISKIKEPEHSKPSREYPTIPVNEGQGIQGDISSAVIGGNIKPVSKLKRKYKGIFGKRRGR